jgi:hypothetical protein
MRKSFVLIGFLGVLLSAPTFNVAASGQAQKPSADNVPSIVIDGLDALRQFGPDEAAKVWAKGSSWEGTLDKGAAADFRNMQQSLGAYKSFEILSVKSLSATLRIVYVTFNFEKEPRFGRFIAYRTARSWILLNYKVDGDVEWYRAELR